MGKLNTVCTFISENGSWNIGVLSHNFSAILQCIAQYLHLTCNHLLYAQYVRVSSGFFNTIL